MATCSNMADPVLLFQLPEMDVRLQLEEQIDCKNYGGHQPSLLQIINTGKEVLDRAKQEQKGFSSNFGPKLSTWSWMQRDHWGLNAESLLLHLRKLQSTVFSVLCNHSATIQMWQKRRVTPGIHGDVCQALKDLCKETFLGPNEFNPSTNHNMMSIS